MGDVKNTIAQQTVQGILALVSRTFVLNILSFGTSLVIYTILAPRDVGIYTAVIAIQRVISFFTDFGFGAALIQKKEDLRREDLTTTFTIQVMLTFLIFIAVFSLQSVLMNFFKLSPVALRLLLALVFTIFLSSFKTIPSILLERRVHFHKLIIPQILESLAFNIILLVLVVNHTGIDSFTWAFLISSILSIPFYYFASPWEIGIGIDRVSLSHLKFGLQFQAKSVLAAIKDDFLTVILAKILTFSELGYIGFGQRISFFVYRYIVDSVTKVTFSSYARIQEDKRLLKTAIEKSLFFVSSSMFPMLMGLIIVSPYIIMYFPKWHNKWEAALASLTFFSLNALVSSLSGILVNVLDSSGRVKLTLRLMIIWTALTWILTPLFIHFYGYNGVSIASFLVSLTIVYTVYLVKKEVPFEFLRSVYKPFIATLIMIVILFISTQLFVKNFMSLLLSVIISGNVYAVCLYMLAHDELKKDLSKIFKKNE